jgi:hypothetical protein
MGVSIATVADGLFAHPPSPARQASAALAISVLQIFVSIEESSFLFTALHYSQLILVEDEENINTLLKFLNKAAIHSSHENRPFHLVV